MTRAALALSLILTAIGARAMEGPVTLESNWTWDTAFSSFTGVTSGVFDVAGLGAGAVSKTGGNVVGFAYSVYATGANANFTIAHATKTFSSLAVNPAGFNNQVPWGIYGTNASISTTTAMVAPNGIAVNGKFEAYTINPYFTLSSLTATATTFIWVEIGRQRWP